MGAAKLSAKAVAQATQLGENSLDKRINSVPFHGTW
jgi:hypothetical protein